jgi:hypothetical protein
VHFTNWSKKYFRMPFTGVAEVTESFAQQGESQKFM